MKNYLEIKFFPDEECPLHFLRNTCFNKLHKALCDLKATDIGISFPQAKEKLGCILRLHSTQARLNELQALKWLGGLSGYCQVTEVLPVPDKVVEYQNIGRIQQNMTNAKLNRLIKRKSISESEIKRYKEKMFKNGLDNLYLELNSTSTNEKYRLYIAFSHKQDTPVAGEFNQFGLSKQSTVPWFE